MERMRMESMDIVAKNVEKIEKLFPDCIVRINDKNGKLQKVVDFDKLKQNFSTNIVDDKTERYEFTWVGKNAAKIGASRPIHKTLRPCIEESKDWDNTENLYIEGDNLDVLKLLQNSYFNKVKMIYIDPPYNTGNDFIYVDDFSQLRKEYEEAKGTFDEKGNRLFKNTDTNGRFHSDWCSMMYSRLILAKNLLTDDGVIFISIDDNEQTNLKKICDEVFGEKNALIPFIWQLPRGINAGLIARAHEYILVYTKNIDKIVSFNRLTNEIQYSIERCNKKIDNRHPESIIKFPAGIRYEGLDKTITGTIEGSEKITIKEGKLDFKNGELISPVSLSAGWTMKNMILEWLKGNTVYDTKGQKIVEFFFKSNGRLYSKKEINTLSIKSVLKDLPDTQDARKELECLFGTQDIFSYPKTIELIKLLSKLVTDSNDIIMDFFSGSGTSAHAVMQLNAEDGGKRKFIMVQFPEKIDEKSVAFKDGYKNICEIGKERIRRAGEKIKEEAGLNGQDLDIGFRVLKLDDSNMKDVYYSIDEYDQQMLSNLEENIKKDRTDLDLLFGCLLDWGVELDKPYITKDINGHKVHIYNDGDLVACFEKDLDMETIDEIAKLQALRVVFRDSCFIDTPSKINVAERFKMIAPDTEIKVI